MTLIKATPEKQAQRAAERAAYLNSTLDGHACDANGVYVDPVTGKRFLSRGRMYAAERQLDADERMYRPNGSRGYGKGI